MSYIDGPDTTIEPIVDGVINLIRRNIAAKTALVQDAHTGDTTIYVDNSLQFSRGDGIAICDEDTSFIPDTNTYDGVEWHTIEGPVVKGTRKLTSTTQIDLLHPLERDFLVSKQAFMRKAIKRAWLNERDVLYGDREVIACDHIAITVEPDSNSNEWLALHGLMSTEYRASVMVYVKFASAGEQEETATRICNAYTAAVQKLLNDNIHLDVDIDEVAIKKDINIGATRIAINTADIGEWPPDNCLRYQLQDNLKSQFFFKILSTDGLSSSSSATSSASFEMSSSSGTMSNSSASSISSSSSVSESSSSSESSVVATRLSSSSGSSLTSESSYPSESSSSLGGAITELLISPAARYHFRTGDKAVLRRMIRYLYDSRASEATYGLVQKGSAILKAGKITWFGKETFNHTFPQIGKGGNAY